MSVETREAERMKWQRVGSRYISQRYQIVFTMKGFLSCVREPSNV